MEKVLAGWPATKKIMEMGQNVILMGEANYRMKRGRQEPGNIIFQARYRGMVALFIF